MIRLAPTYDLFLGSVRDVLSGRRPIAAGHPRNPAKTSSGAVVIAPVTDIDRRAARALQVDASHVPGLAKKAWGHGLAVERDRRLAAAHAEGKNAAAVRGHITRQLLKELRSTLEDS